MFIGFIGFCSINLDNLQIKSTASLPFVNAEGMYDVDAHLMNMALKGKGHFTGNACKYLKT